MFSLQKLLISEKMIELGYWKIRGLVGGARVMLEHAGAGTDSLNRLAMSERYGPYPVGLSFGPLRHLRWT